MNKRVKDILVIVINKRYSQYSYFKRAELLTYMYNDYLIFHLSGMSVKDSLEYVLDIWIYDNDYASKVLSEK